VSPPAEDEAWYESAFAAGYVDVYPHRNLEAARAEVAGLVRRDPKRRGLAGRVLDLGCGFGRHTLAMLEQGLDVYGVDLSRDLLLHAAHIDQEGRLAARLLRGEFRHLPFRAASFDAVVMLFSSFGYFDETGNGRVLDEIARVLRPGATALFDLMNPTRIRQGLVPESRRVSGGRVLTERRCLADGERRVQKEVHLREPDGSERRWREDVRLYDPEEFALLLARHSLARVRVEGDFHGGELVEDSPRQLVWARR